MILDGIIMLQNGSNPALIREHLKGYLENAGQQETKEGQ
jgi:flagellar motor component MotA